MQGGMYYYHKTAELCFMLGSCDAHQFRESTYVYTAKKSITFFFFLI